MSITGRVLGTLLFVGVVGGTIYLALSTAVRWRQESYRREAEARRYLQGVVGLRAISYRQAEDYVEVGFEDGSALRVEGQVRAAIKAVRLPPAGTVPEKR